MFDHLSLSLVPCCSVASSSPAPHSLYRRLGYRVDREEAFLNGMAVYMSKSLA